MENRIVYRPYKRSDYDILKNIVRKTWNYDKFAGPKIADKMARIALNSCLANQTFTNVAVAGGVPVGVVMGRNIKSHKKKVTSSVKTGVSILSLFKGKEGRDVFKMFESISGIDRDLLKSCQKDYQGEVVFFAVDDAYQGKGVGKKLFRSLMAYMDTEHIQDVYLYTDTSCNYEFYENQGMTKRCEKGYTFDVNGRTEKMSFYIYDFRR